MLNTKASFGDKKAKHNSKDKEKCTIDVYVVVSFF
jgi:hypothetical protein